VTLVYQAANLVDAQLAADELTHGDIVCEVTGQYLSGAIGELPPTEVLGVRVLDPADEQRARRLIAEWELSVCWQCGEPEAPDP